MAEFWLASTEEKNEVDRPSLQFSVGLLQRHDTTTLRADVGSIADAYSALADKGRVRFFAMLAREFWSDPVAVDRAITARNSAVGDVAVFHNGYYLTLSRAP